MYFYYKQYSIITCWLGRVPLNLTQSSVALSSFFFHLIWGNYHYITKKQCKLRCCLNCNVVVLYISLNYFVRKLDLLSIKISHFWHLDFLMVHFCKTCLRRNSTDWKYSSNNEVNVEHLLYTHFKCYQCYILISPQSTANTVLNVAALRAGLVLNPVVVITSFMFSSYQSHANQTSLNFIYSQHITNP